MPNLRDTVEEAADKPACEQAHVDSNAPADGSDRLTLPPYRDAYFYQRRKKGKWRKVDAPRVDGPLADTHCHLHMLPDPGLELARMAVCGVEFASLITDPSEDGLVVFDSLDGWMTDAAGLIAELVATPPYGEASGGLDEAAAADAPGTCADAPATEEESLAAQADAEREIRLPHVRISAGVHPHNARLYDDAMEARLIELLADSRVCAIGEIGLDYHYDFSPRETQRAVFRRQIQLAHKLGLPIALHIREAHDEALAILCEEGFPAAGTLLHCCALPEEQLAPWVDAGCYIAYGGALTFKKADDVRAACTMVPAEKLLAETDAPYMTPEPMRGVACTPAHVVFTAALLSKLTGVSLNQLAANAKSLLDRENPACLPALSQRGDAR